MEKRKVRQYKSYTKMDNLKESDLIEVKVINKSRLLGKEIDVYGSAENPLFLAKDVAEWIEHSNPRAILEYVDDDEKGVRIVYTLGGNQKTWFLTEDGLYEVLMQSRKPIAKEFKRGIKKILHEIRTKGGYMVAKQDDTPESIMARAILIAQDTMKRQQERIEQQQRQIEADKPKVAFADAITSSNTSCLIGELAKLIRQAVERTGCKIAIGQNRFFGWLRENGFLGRSTNYYNIANQEYIEQGLFELKKTVHDENGVLVTKTTTKVTGKGQQYFINGFLSGKFQLRDIS